MNTQKCYQIVKCKNKYNFLYFSPDKGWEVLLKNGEKANKYPTKKGLFIVMKKDNYYFVAYYSNKKDDIVWYKSGIGKFLLDHRTAKSYSNVLFFEILLPNQCCFFSEETGEKVLGSRILKNVYFHIPSYREKIELNIYKIVNGELELKTISGCRILHSHSFVAIEVAENCYRVFNSVGYESPTATGIVSKLYEIKMKGSVPEVTKSDNFTTLRRIISDENEASIWCLAN